VQESILMAFMLFMIYFLPGVSASEIKSFDSSKSNFQSENSEFKSNVSGILSAKEISFSDIIVPEKVKNPNSADYYKLDNDNNKINHLFSYNNNLYLKIKPDIIEEFYFFHYAGSFEEHS